MSHLIETAVMSDDTKEDNRFSYGIVTVHMYGLRSRWITRD